MRRASSHGIGAKRDRALFETELLEKPYSSICCGNWIYWIAKTLCLRCHAKVRLYEKAMHRDAVRRWLMHARMQKRQSMEPAVRYDILEMDKTVATSPSSSP